MPHTIVTWLAQTATARNYSFEVRDFVGNPEVQNISKKIGARIFESYRDPEYLKSQFQNENEEALFTYLESYVFPAKRDGSANNITSIVKIGDFGEIISSEIVSRIDALEVPLKKMMWKVRNDKSMFCTDIFAHNTGENLTHLYYYEVKTRTTLSKDTTKRREGRFYVAVQAHDAIKRDMESPHEHIADFLSRMYFENARLAENVPEEAEKLRSKSHKYAQVVKNCGAFERHYRLCLILDKQGAFSEDVISELHNLPTEINPLHIDLVLVESLQTIISDSFKHAYTEARAFVFGG